MGRILALIHLATMVIIVSVGVANKKLIEIAKNKWIGGKNTINWDFSLTTIRV